MLKSERRCLTDYVAGLRQNAERARRLARSLTRQKDRETILQFALELDREPD
jgi:hypothetical protein